ncbi:MAG: hypothetical protein ABGZ17_29630 [Planctomycetaceae bacterium]
MSRRVAILTLIGNTSSGTGPGHTAIVVDNRVYSFENAGDWFSLPNRERSGWKSFTTRAYLNQNRFRPVVVQEMNATTVNANSVARYIRSSIAADDDYMGSGVCSSQVSNAIDAATRRSFNPRGVDTPLKVFNLARTQGLASATYLIWASPQNNAAATKLSNQYSSVTASGTGILSWTP